MTARKSKYVKKISGIFLEKTKEFFVQTGSPEETENIGCLLAKWVKKHRINCVIFVGPFGTGKTTMIRGMIRYLTGENIITSPSFSIVNEYISKDFSIFHFDFYRIKSPQELESFGFSQYLDKGLLLIEWPEIGVNKIPLKFIKVSMEFDGLKSRNITITHEKTYT
ncbi:MAG TPA: tRNA (adenosine(37)-N6)-threonylcarbamoyltransferase complex ATPase subunit type 1 TsaE [bacterium]|nr:tRNA (adenosine(37)-N6)-threonylcarbamoyltransferase complex ATPase subunit type 1 TsaE [bacterium]